MAACGAPETAESVFEIPGMEHVAGIVAAMDRKGFRMVAHEALAAFLGRA